MIEDDKIEELCRELTHEEMLQALAADPEHAQMLDAYKRMKPGMQAAWRRQDAEMCKLVALGSKRLRAKLEQARARPSGPGEIRLTDEAFDTITELLLKAAEEIEGRKQ